MQDSSRVASEDVDVQGQAACSIVGRWVPGRDDDLHECVERGVKPAGLRRPVWSSDNSRMGLEGGLILLRARRARGDLASLHT
jgi:hypothetical protein